MTKTGRGNRVTHKPNTSEFSVEKLKAVTDKQNRVKVAIPSSVYSYRSYYGMPSNLNWDSENEDFSAIVAALAYLLDENLLHLMRGAYERYWAHLMEVEYHQVFSHPKEEFKKQFDIIQATAISAKLYQNSILYVYQDGRILIMKDKKLADKVKKIRGLE